MMHTFGENSRVLMLQAGTLINGAGGGTANALPVGDFQHVTVAYVGTFANNGTINVIACTNAGGSVPTIIRTLNIGSADGHWAAVDVSTNALNKISPGTQFTHIGALGTVESGGTWRGALFVVGHNPRVAPPGTTGLVTNGYGTYLA
jgi:hypothetical protein